MTAKQVWENLASLGLFVLLVNLWMFQAILDFLLSSDGYFYWAHEIKNCNALLLINICLLEV